MAIQIVALNSFLEVLFRVSAYPLLTFDNYTIGLGENVHTYIYVHYNV